MSDDLRDFLAKARRGSAQAAKIIRLDELSREEVVEQPWGLAALRGRLVELSARGASATLTTAASLVLEAQKEAEPVAWIVPWAPVIGDVTHTSPGTFYPPDAADSGIDLSALVVVRAPSIAGAGRAAERLLRSGAFGLVVLDFGSIDVAAARVSDAMLGRLVSLAQTNDAAVVCLTEKTPDAGSLGSLVSLRAEALRTRGTDGYEVTVRALKDKRRGPGWSRAAKVRGPSGL